MSAVISQTKQFYRKALAWQAVGLVGISAVSVLFVGMAAGSFFAGLLCAFLPFCAFTYWVFFRQIAQPAAHRMAVFYRAEALKWLLTIILVVAAIKLVPQFDYIVFFVGYFLGLSGNIVLPIWFKRSAK